MLINPLNISTSDHMFKREIRDKFTKFTFSNLPSETTDFKVLKNERGKFCPNFTNKHMISC